MLIYGVTVDLPGNASAAFRCTAPADSGTFTVPAQVLSVLPATRRDVRKTKAVIYLMPSPVSNGVPFVAAGLDAAAALTYHMIGKTVLIQ
jgi:hypothetical protein